MDDFGCAWEKNKSLEKAKQNIPLLSPIIFKKNHIRNNTDELLNDENISEFFIHAFQDDEVKLNLPLPPHKKTVNDFVFVFNGSMTKNLGIESFNLKKNDFLFTPKNNITTTEMTSADLEGFYGHFSDEFVGANSFLRTLHAQPNRPNYLRILPAEATILEFLLARIVQLYKNRKNNENDYRIIPFYLSAVFAELFLTLDHQQIPSNQHSELFLKFQVLVDQQFKQNLTIAEYASQLHVSPNHLNKRIKSETGKTTSELIKEITILEAKVLLLQTKMTVKEISNELGFNDDSYFSRLFKNETNYTPSNYRKMIDLS